jgi:uncharacterized protein YhfF
VTAKHHDNSNTVSFAFGDSPEMADALLALVLSGKKTATCGRASDFGPGKAALPEIGRLDLILDGNGRPGARIETLEVTFRRFDEIDADFARDEGEGFATPAEWRDGHRDYFERNGGCAPDMTLVCERFRLVEALEREAL